MTCSGPAEYEWPEEGRESLFQDEHLCSPGKRSKHTIHEVLLCIRSKIKEQRQQLFKKIYKTISI